MKWLIRIIQALLILSFLMAGLQKLAGAQEMVESFTRWGYSTSFMYFGGFVETVAALALVVGYWKPRAAAVGAALLVADMIGAVFFTHIRLGEGFVAALPAAVLLLFAGLVGRHYAAAR